MSRVEVALAEIALRRGLAETARLYWHQPSGFVGDHIAANDPWHVLDVLDAAEATLRRHEQMLAGDCSWCGPEIDWPCPDATAVLDIYALVVPPATTATPRACRATSCGVRASLPASWPGPSREAACTLRPHTDAMHIDNYLGGFRWTGTSARADSRTPDPTP